MNESDMIEFRMQERRGIPTGIEYYLLKLPIAKMGFAP